MVPVAYRSNSTTSLFHYSKQSQCVNWNNQNVFHFTTCKQSKGVKWNNQNVSHFTTESGLKVGIKTITMCPISLQQVVSRWESKQSQCVPFHYTSGLKVWIQTITICPISLQQMVSRWESKQLQCVHFTTTSGLKVGIETITMCDLWCVAQGYAETTYLIILKKLKITPNCAT